MFSLELPTKKDNVIDVYKRQQFAIEQSVFSRILSRVRKQSLCVWLQISIYCIFLQDSFHPLYDLIMNVSASPHPCGNSITFRASNIDNFSFFINGNYSPRSASQDKDLIHCRAIRQRTDFPIFWPVSYTHLDVYKRQDLHCAEFADFSEIVSS